MTEDDAWTKWCPFSRVIVTRPGSTFPPHNRVAALDSKPSDEPDDVPGALCIGSSCMAWRFDKGEYEYWYTRSHEPALTGPWEEWPVQPDEPPSFGMDMKRWRRLTPDRIGYCGLAGKP